MFINIIENIEGARTAEGLAVIIDVFRACSTACYAFYNGASKIIPVNSINCALKIKKKNQDYILMGEKNGIKPPDFDHGNSPARIENKDFTGKTIIHATGAGTRGFVNARKAKEIISGSFVNAGAVVEYILKKNYPTVTLVAMGIKGKERATEDILCAEYIKNELTGKFNDDEKLISHLKSIPEAQKFFNPEIEWAPERDFKLCTSLNKFDFILKVHLDSKGQFCLKRQQGG